MPTTYVNGTRQAYGVEKVSTLTSSTGLTEANYLQNVDIAGASARQAQEVMISVETGAIRYTVDGTTPTTTATTGIGHLAQPGDILVIAGYQNIKNFRAINAVASNGAELRVTFYR